MWRPWSSEENPQDENIILNIENDGENNSGCHEEIIIEINSEFEDENIGESSAGVKRKKLQYLPPEAKQIVLNVYTSLKERGQLPEEDLIKETANLTKMTYSLVWRTIKHGIVPRKVRCDKGVLKKLTPEMHAYLVRKIIYDSFKRNFVPTLKYVRDMILQRINIECAIETVRKFLIIIGFDFETIDRRQVLKESRRISEWRYKYLQAIQKHRQENKTIIYLDETWFDSHDVVKKGWIDESGQCVLNVPASRGHRIIILHAGSQNGWVEDALYLSAKNIKDAKVDYHDEMTGEVFFEWFSQKLIPKLPPHSVIILDNASYHSVQSEKIPNSNSTKEDIKKFLEKNDLFYDDDYNKKQLLEVLHTKEHKTKYFVDEEAKKHGHEVLRLPPYHCEFNPIEMIWGILKGRVRRNNTNPKFSSGTVNVIKAQTDTVTQEEWANCVRKVISIEDEYRSKQVEELIINLGDENSDDD